MSKRTYRLTNADVMARLAVFIAAREMAHPIVWL